MNEFLWNFSTSNGFSINTENNSGANDGLPVIPGKYAAQLSYFDGNTVKTLTDSEPFEVKSLGWATLPIQDYQALQSFANEVKDFSRVVNGTTDHLDFLKEKHKALKAAMLANTNSKLENMATLTQMEREFQKINLNLNGNEALEKHQFEVLPGISDRIRTIVFGMYGHSTEPTTTQKQGLAYAKKLFGETYKSVIELDKNMNELQKTLEKSKIPYIQGSLPKWD
jgi:predicted HicB family RNase H-like nuclease